MNIYKGLLMMHGYLTTVEPEDVPRADGDATAPESRPGPDSRAAAPRGGLRSVSGVATGRTGDLACACD